jgi:thioredoxin-dependent peroxiredoxin
MPAAAPPPSLLKEGDPAPDVTLHDQDGKPFRLRDLRGKRVVLFFYPADMTPGCTTEACQFNDALPQFEAKGAVVIGVSPDDAASHRKFIAKHGLGYKLAFDPTNKALEAFGVWQEKSMYGRTYMGVVRSTFVLSTDGKVEQALYKVKPDGHAADVLARLAR